MLNNKYSPLERPIELFSEERLINPPPPAAKEYLRTMVRDRARGLWRPAVSTTPPPITSEHSKSPPPFLKILLGAAGLAVIAAAGSAIIWGNVARHASHQPLELLPVTTANLTASVTAPGRVVSKKRVDITTPLPGVISTVSVKERDWVKHGQVLATLDNRTEQIQLAQAQAKLLNARGELATAKRAVESILPQVAAGAIPTQTISDAQVALESAQTYLDYVHQEYQAAQIALERRVITAPFDGLIAASYAVDGLWAQPPGALFTLVDPRDLEVELQVDGQYRNLLSTGLPVELTSDAFPDALWTAPISRLGAVVRNSANPKWTSVMVNLDSSAPPLNLGHPIDASIQTTSRSNVKQVPSDAIGTKPDGNTTVAVIENGRVHYALVTVGTMTATHVEIRKGVRSGQFVLPLKRLRQWPKEGDAVATQDPAQIAQTSNN